MFVSEAKREKDMTGKASEMRRTSIGSQRNPASQEAILQAAEDILAEGGFRAFSIEAVARRAHAGKPTIYRWWPSRAALLLDVYQRQKYDLSGTDSMAPDTGGIEGDVLALLRRLFAYWYQGHAGDVFRSVIAEAQTDPTTRQALAAFMEDRYDQGGEMFRRGKTRGEVADWVDPKLAMEIVTSFAWQRLLTDRLDEDPRRLEDAVRMICMGFKARP
jgi:AcrR family transcriptional regulator